MLIPTAQKFDMPWEEENQSPSYVAGRYDHAQIPTVVVVVVVVVVGDATTGGFCCDQSGLVAMLWGPGYVVELVVPLPLLAGIHF